MNRYTRTVINYLRNAPDEHWVSYVCQSNDDANKDVLAWMIEQPRMPDSAALALYWMMDPVFFLKVEDEKDIWDKVDYEIVRTLERGLLEVAYKAAAFGFDPRNDRIMGEDWVTSQGFYLKEGTSIPPQLLEAIDRPQLDPATLPDGNEGLPEYVLADMYDWEEE